MDMLYDGMFVPEEQADGSFVWENPAGKSCSLELSFMGFLEVG